MVGIITITYFPGLVIKSNTPLQHELLAFFFFPKKRNFYNIFVKERIEKKKILLTWQDVLGVLNCNSHNFQEEKVKYISVYSDINMFC